MSNFYRILIEVFFLIWFILSIGNQFNFKFVSAIKKYDFFHLLPRWTFFAPNPGTVDYHFVYRTKNIEEEISTFKEIPLYGKRKLISSVWNSEKRVKKALLDLVMDLNRLCALKEIDESNIKLSLCYIALLNFTCNVPKSSDTKSIQFAILKTQGFIDNDQPILIICSEFHNV